MKRLAPEAASYAAVDGGNNNYKPASQFACVANHSYPDTAYVLTLVAAVFVLIGGIFLTLAIIGIFGIICAIVMFYFANQLRTDPASHTTAGAVIIVLSVISWVVSLGGLLIGFVFGLIGGILAITWTPTIAFTPRSQLSGRICAFCSSTIPPGSTVCPTCGAQIQSA